MEEFGEAVLAIVEGGTDADVSPKPPWRERKEAYLAHLEKAPPSVLLVSASDQLFVCQEWQFGWVKEPKGNSIAVEVAVRLQPKRKVSSSELHLEVVRQDLGLREMVGSVG